MLDRFIRRWIQDYRYMVQLREISAVTIQRFYHKHVVLYRIMRNIAVLKRLRAAELVIKHFIDKIILKKRYFNQKASLIQLFIRSKMFKVKMKRIIKVTKMAITTNMTRLYDTVLKVLEDKMNYINDLLKEAIPDDIVAKVNRIVSSKKEKNEDNMRPRINEGGNDVTDVNIFYNYMKKIRCEAKSLQQKMLLAENSLDNVKMAINSSFRIAMLYDQIAEEYRDLNQKENAIKVNKTKKSIKNKKKNNIISTGIATTASKANLTKMKRNNSNVHRRGSNGRRNSDAKSVADSIGSEISDEYLTLTHTESAIFSDESSTDSDTSVAMSRQGSTSSIAKSSSKRRISGVGGTIALSESNLSSLNLLHERSSSRRSLQKSSSKISKKRGKKAIIKKEKGPRYTFGNLDEYHDDTIDVYVKAVKNGQNITKENLLNKVSNLAKNAAAFYKAVEENDTVGFRETLLVVKETGNGVDVNRNIVLDKSSVVSIDMESLLSHLTEVKYRLQPNDSILKNLMWYSTIKSSINANKNEILQLKSSHLKSMNGSTFASMQLVNAMESIGSIAKPAVEPASNTAYPIVLCKQLLWNITANYGEFEALVSGSRNMIRSAEWLLGLISETIKCVASDLMNARLLPPLPNMSSYASCVVSPVGFNISLNKPMSGVELTIYKCLASGIASPYQKINKNDVNYRDGVVPIVSYTNNLIQSMRRMSDGSVLTTHFDTNSSIMIDSVDLAVAGATNIDPNTCIIQAISGLKGSKQCKDTIFDLIACINKLRVNSAVNSRTTGAITLFPLITDNGTLLLFACYVLSLVSHFDSNGSNGQKQSDFMDFGVIPVQISLGTAINCLQYLIEGRPTPSWRSINEIIHNIIVKYQQSGPQSTKTNDVLVKENDLLVQCVTRVFELVGFDIKTFSNKETSKESDDTATTTTTNNNNNNNNDNKLVPRPPSIEQPSNKVTDISPRTRVPILDEAPLSVANRNEIIENTNIIIDNTTPMPENMTMYEYQKLLQQKQDEQYKNKFIEETFDFSILNRTISPYDLVLVLLDHHVKQINDIKFAIKANEYFVKADTSQIGTLHTHVYTHILTHSLINVLL